MEDFKEELFGCQKTPGLFCFLSLFSCIGGPCCIQGKVTSEFSSKSCVYHCILPCCCLCIGASLNRQTLRKRLGMENNFLKDCCVHMICNICAVNQEFLETHRYRSQGTMNLLQIGLKNNNSKVNRSFTPDAPKFETQY